MKSVICSLVLIAALSIGGSAFGQGRGRPAGPPPGQSRAPASVNHGPDQSSVDRDAGRSAHARNDRESDRTGKELHANPKLASNLQGLLPPGTDMNLAASGFKNMGQFVAAVHVSHNLGIPFDQLKAKMVGEHMPLGRAIHTLKPGMNEKTADAEAKRAEAEAKRAEAEAKKDTNKKG